MSDDKATLFIKNAKKKLNPFFLFKKDYESARELYSKAAIQFKLIRKWTEAADAYMSAYKCYKNPNYESILCLTEASKCYKKCDINKYINCLENAINESKEC